MFFVIASFEIFISLLDSYLIGPSCDTAQRHIANVIVTMAAHFSPNTPHLSKLRIRDAKSFLDVFSLSNEYQRVWQSIFYRDMRAAGAWCKTKNVQKRFVAISVG